MRQSSLEKTKFNIKHYFPFLARNTGCLRGSIESGRWYFNTKDVNLSLIIAECIKRFMLSVLS